MDDLGAGAGSDSRDPLDTITDLLADHLAGASPDALRRWAADLRDQADELDRIAAERDSS